MPFGNAQGPTLALSTTVLGLLSKTFVAFVLVIDHTAAMVIQVNNWNRFNANSGGTLVEKCCHFFDLMRLFAAANPVRVMASGAIDVNHKDEIYDGKVSYCSDF